MYRIHGDLTVSDGDDFTYGRALPTRATFECDYPRFAELVGDPEPYGFIVPVATPCGPIVIWRESAAAATPIWHVKARVEEPVVWLFGLRPGGLHQWSCARGAHGDATLAGHVAALTSFLEVRVGAMAEADAALAEHTGAVARVLRLVLEATDLRNEIGLLREQLVGKQGGAESVRAARGELADVLLQLLHSSTPGFGALRA